MLNRRRGNTGGRHRLLLSWMLSYLVILLLPLLAGGYGCVKAIDAIRTETMETQRLSLEQLRHVIDLRFEELSGVGYTVIASKSLQKLVSAGSELKPAQLLDIVHAQKELSSQVRANAFLDGMYIYIKDSGACFSDRRKYATYELDQLLYSELGFSPEGFQAYLDASHVKDAVFLASSDGTRHILYVLTLFDRAYQKSRGLIMMRLDGEQIWQTLDRVKLIEQESIVLVDGEGQCFSGENDGEMARLARDEGLSGSVRSIGGEEYAVSACSSDLLPLRYVTFLPTQHFLRKTWEIQRFLVYYVIACVTLGLVLAFWFAKINHSPVQKLISLFQSRGEGRQLECANEYTFLEKAARLVLDENKSFEQRLELQSAAIVNQLMTKLLKHRLTDCAQLKSSLADYGVRFEPVKYRIALFCPAESERLRDAYSASLLYGSIREAMAEELPDAGFYQCIETDGMAACVFSDREGDAQSVRRAAQRLEQAFEVPLLVAIGVPFEGVEGMPGAYSDTLEGLEYRKLLGIGEHVVDCGELRAQYRRRVLPGLDAEREQRLIACMRSGEFDEAQRVVSDMMTECFDERLGLVKTVRFRMNCMVNMMLNAIGEMKNGPYAGALGELDATALLLSADTERELRERIAEIFA